MKTSKMFITIVTALAMASCNNDKEFANQPELEMQVPEAYASFSISIPHTSGTRSVTTRSRNRCRKYRKIPSYIYLR